MFDMLTSPYTHPLKKLIWMRMKAGARAVWDTVTGNPVTFSAIAAPLKQLQIAFSPVQDLHGYDSPWPAGGGANKWDEELEVGGIDDSTGEPSISPTQRRSKNFIPVSPETSYYACTPNAGTGGFWVYCYDANKAFIGRVQSSGGGYDLRNKAFTTLANCKYIKLKTQSSDGNYADIAINYPSSVTTYSPYSNICPISGWSSLGVEQRGKNLFDKDSANITNGWWYAPNLVVGEPLGNYTESGNYHTSAPIPVVAGQTLTVVGCGGGNGSFLYLDKDMNYLDGFINQSQSSRTFTVPNNPQIAYVRFPFATATVDTCQLELGSTATAYVPYNGCSISISLGETVYSGYVDVISGVGEVTMAVLDLGKVVGNWGYNSSTSMFNKLLPTDAKIPANNVPANALCEQFAVYSYNALSSQSVGFAFRNEGANSTIRIKDPRYTDPDDFKTAMDGVQLVYKLAAPIPIQLTPQEVESLLGENVMWSDANGDLTVTYAIDPATTPIVGKGKVGQAVIGG